MKKIIFLFPLVLIVFIFSCERNKIKTDSKLPVDNPSFTIKGRLIMGLDDAFPPMGFRSADNKIIGFDVDLAKEITKRLNIDLILQPIDWVSKEIELKTGSVDCVWNALSETHNRSESMLLSRPYFRSRMVIVVSPESVVKFKAGLKGKQIGVQSGSTAIKALQSDSIYKEISKMIEFENNILALNDLEAGRIDAVIVDEVLAKYIISKTKRNFAILDENLGEEVYVIAFNKNNKKLKAKIESTFADMLKDGTAAEISKKWFGEDILLKW